MTLRDGTRQRFLAAAIAADIVAGLSVYGSARRRSRPLPAPAEG